MWGCGIAMSRDTASVEEASASVCSGGLAGGGADGVFTRRLRKCEKTEREGGEVGEVADVEGEGERGLFGVGTRDADRGR